MAPKRSPFRCSYDGEIGWTESGKVETLRRHDVTLFNGHLALRPMTEDDWGILLKWNNDPEVLYFSEGDDVAEYSLEEVQQIYRLVSQSAFCFIIEFGGVPVGECWLQEMNLARILRQHPGLDCRRIDLMIGDKTFWGKGVGTQVIRLLVDFAFNQENADAVFACDVADYNLRSLKMFRRVGFEILAANLQPIGGKANLRYDLMLMRG